MKGSRSSYIALGSCGPTKESESEVEEAPLSSGEAGVESFGAGTEVAAGF
jgi:hypothetical protein